MRYTSNSSTCAHRPFEYEKRESHWKKATTAPPTEWANEWMNESRRNVIALSTKAYAYSEWQLLWGASLEPNERSTPNAMPKNGLVRVNHFHVESQPPNVHSCIIFYDVSCQTNFYVSQQKKNYLMWIYAIDIHVHSSCVYISYRRLISYLPCCLFFILHVIFFLLVCSLSILLRVCGNKRNKEWNPVY